MSRVWRIERLHGTTKAPRPDSETSWEVYVQWITTIWLDEFANLIVVVACVMLPFSRARGRIGQAGKLPEKASITMRPIFAVLLFSIGTFDSFAGMAADAPRAESSIAGKLDNGQDIRQFTLRNRHGMRAKVIEYGATLTELLVPDRDGKFASVVLGSDSLQSYTKGFPSASIIGRYANRIRGAKFNLDGQEVRVTRNAGENHIHGGQNNFAKVRWQGTTHVQDDAAYVELTYVSADGEEGFPGTLRVSVTYLLNDRNELNIRYAATTDKTTVVNLTNHAYFNLSGGGDVLQHELELMADTTTVVDRSLIPTGEIVSVVGTPLDFLTPHKIGERIEKLYESARGYDHNYIVNGKPGSLRLAAKVTEPNSGRVMECLTTEPGVQLYTANGFNGNPFPKHGAFCLETQHYPDSPNHPDFPSTTVRPNERWTSSTVFRFSLK